MSQSPDRQITKSPNPTPVLVIHGIAQRKREKVERDVARMNEAMGDRFELIPVYWGDLGANDAHLHRVMGRYEQRAESFWHMMADSAARPVVRSWGKSLVWLTVKRGDKRLAASLRSISEENTEKMDVRVRGYLNEKFQAVRRWMTSAVLPWVADTIVYQSHTYRVRIQQRVREVIAAKLPPEAGTAAMPVTVIAHSLGGVIAFDMAVAAENPLHVKHLVTLGSQPGFFHVLDPRGVVPVYDGEPVQLPTTIGRWTNIWDEHDLLGFGISEVFRLHDGSAPIEAPVRCYRNALRGAAMFRGHLGYWDRAPALRRVRAALEQGA